VQWVKPLRKEADADVAHQRIFRKVRSGFWELELNIFGWHLILFITIMIETN
jgi:hypothetical protein